MGYQQRKVQSERDEETQELPVAKPELIAKKDFSIHHNEYHREIKKGDDLSDVPELYLDNLRTEGVI